MGTLCSPPFHEEIVVYALTSMKNLKIAIECQIESSYKHTRLVLFEL